MIVLSILLAVSVLFSILLKCAAQDIMDRQSDTIAEYELAVRKAVEAANRYPIAKWDIHAIEMKDAITKLSEVKP